jgi:hypothetical protein
MKKYIKATLKTTDNLEYEVFVINRECLKTLDIVTLIKTFVSIAVKTEKENLMLIDCFEVCRKPTKGVFVIRNCGDYWVHKKA